jgi:hypothetical protein
LAGAGFRAKAIADRGRCCAARREEWKNECVYQAAGGWAGGLEQDWN